MMAVTSSLVTAPAGSSKHLEIKLSSQDLERLYNLDDLIDGVAVPLPVRASQRNDHS